MANITINDANYYYELHGEGHPIILISGYTRDNTAWLPLLDSLSKHFQVLIFDNRGVGRTTDNNGPLSVELMAKDIMLLADKLNLRKPHIIGQSMGGNIAQVIASHYADNISKLSIIVSSAKWRKAMLRGLRSTLMMRENNVNFDIIFEATCAWVFGEALLSNQKWLADFKQFILNNPYPQSVENQARQFKALEQFDGTALLSKITAPTLVVHGKQDILALLSEGEFLANQIKNATFVEVNCAHGIIVEETKVLSDLLINFLK